MQLLLFLVGTESYSRIGPSRLAEPLIYRCGSHSDAAAVTMTLALGEDAALAFTPNTYV